MNKTDRKVVELIERADLIHRELKNKYPPNEYGNRKGFVPHISQIMKIAELIQNQEAIEKLEQKLDNVIF